MELPEEHQELIDLDEAVNQTQIGRSTLRKYIRTFNVPVKKGFKGKTLISPLAIKMLVTIKHYYLLGMPQDDIHSELQKVIADPEQGIDHDYKPDSHDLAGSQVNTAVTPYSKFRELRDLVESYQGAVRDLQDVIHSYQKASNEQEQRIIMLDTSYQEATKSIESLQSELEQNREDSLRIANVQADQIQYLEKQLEELKNQTAWQKFKSWFK